MMKSISIFISKLLLSILVTLIILILIKSSTGFKNNFYKYTYGSNISFAKFNELYKKYIGNSDVLSKVENTKTVFTEKLTYKNVSKYMDGAKLEVGNNYSVPVEKSGIVVFIGNKDGYNNTVIIQRIDGIDEWYGNITNVNVKLYDYVLEGSIIGQSNNELYLVYKKDGNVLNYEEYLK